MHITDLEKFKGLLTDAMAYYRLDVSKFTLDLWWEACRRYDYEQVEKALHKHAMHPDHGQFAPKVADIVRALGGTTTDRAAVAWGKVHDAMSSVGAWQDVVFDDPAIHAAIEDLGGWPKVARTENDELGFLQARFQKSYRAYIELESFEFPRRLCGARDPDEEYQARGLPLPRPYLIGQRERCIQVLQLGGAQGRRLAQLGVGLATKLLGHNEPPQLRGPA